MKIRCNDVKKKQIITLIHALNQTYYNNNYCDKNY
jgi:hypothetical protein